ncbi:hypothetical protein HN51_033709 [Arachis hypogaea]|uniref:uncharacterized protein LOC107629398 n=1 Tax=Arachis ipaensis TaxID=130454 RepID=UPI0007AF0A58|nr:uncharacterized protein LOC107629398 [Arachis ipaensis]XP_025641454.1 uncharacterized protein LOC112736284 [Arachis hypogaea]QHO07151.1 uncharacterized protein DS421_14g461110 [Arachis hypogaea]
MKKNRERGFHLESPKKEEHDKESWKDTFDLSGIEEPHMAELLKDPSLGELLTSSNLYLLLIKGDIDDVDKAFITQTKELLHYVIPFLAVNQQDCPPILEEIFDVCKIARPCILLLRGSRFVSHYFCLITPTQLSLAVSPHIEADTRDLSP